MLSNNYKRKFIWFSILLANTQKIESGELFLTGVSQNTQKSRRLTEAEDVVRCARMQLALLDHTLNMHCEKATITNEHFSNFPRLRGELLLSLSPHSHNYYVTTLHNWEQYLWNQGSLKLSGRKRGSILIFALISLQAVVQACGFMNLSGSFNIGNYWGLVSIVSFPGIQKRCY